MNLSHKLIKLAARALLLLGLAANGAAWAVCDVSLVTVFANGQAVLKADCYTGLIPPGTAASIDHITWLQNGSAIPGVTNLSVIPNTQDIYYTTAITTGTSTYTAIGNPNTPATLIPQGKAATITTGQTALHVAASVGGTVTSNPAGIISCTNSGGTCEAPFPMGAPVTLTYSASPGFSFSSWSGDCTGTGVSCIVAMTSPRTVVATFGSTPVCTLGAAPTPIVVGSSSTLTAICSGSPTSWVWSSGSCSSANATCTVTPPVGSNGFTVAGVNGGGTGAVSNTATVQVNPLQPSCTLAANPSAVNFGSTTPVVLTATCSGFPTSYIWAGPTPAGPQVATGNVNPFTAIFSAVVAANTYTYSVQAVNGGGTSQPASASVMVSTLPPPSCTLTATPNSFTVGTATTVTLTANCTNSPQTYAWTGTPAVAGSGNSVTASFLASAMAGTYTYTVAATGPGGLGAAFSVPVTVNAVVQGPNCAVVDVAATYPGWPSGEGSTGGQPLLSSNPNTTIAYKIAASQVLNPDLVSTGSGTVAGFSNYSGSPGTTMQISNQPCFINPTPAPATASTALECQFTGSGAFDPRFSGIGPNTSAAYKAAYAPYGTYCQLPQPDAGGFYYVNLRTPAVCNQGATCQYFMNFWKH